MKEVFHAKNVARNSGQLSIGSILVSVKRDLIHAKCYSIIRIIDTIRPVGFITRVSAGLHTKVITLCYRTGYIKIRLSTHPPLPLAKCWQEIV